MGSKLYVGNLSFNTTEADLKDAFGAAGTVESVELIQDKFSGKSRGFGFVTMASDQDAQNAITQFHGKEVDGRALTVIDHPLVRVKLSAIRSVDTSLAGFREGITELATLMTFEVTRSLQTRECSIQTPLAGYAGSQLARPIILAPILRAGLGMLEG